MGSADTEDGGDPMDVSLAKLESEAKEVARVPSTTTTTTAPVNSIASARFAALKATTATH